MNRGLLIAVLYGLSTWSIPSTAAANGVAFVAELSGDNEVPPVASDGSGLAAFFPNGDETELKYLLFIDGLQDVLASHIHLAEPDQNGPVVAFLYQVNGGIAGEKDLLTDGVLTEDDTIGPLADQSISVLVTQLEVGDGYVNVHTAAHPSGEIRGQIESACGCLDLDRDGWVSYYGPCDGVDVGAKHLNWLDECRSFNDCDDSDPSVYPFAEEIPGDGVDQNCNSATSCGALSFAADGTGGHALLAYGLLLIAIARPWRKRLRR